MAWKLFDQLDKWHWSLAVGLGLLTADSAQAGSPIAVKTSTARAPFKPASTRIPASRLVKPKQVAQSEELPPLQSPPADAGLEQPEPRQTPPSEPQAPEKPEQTPAVADRGIFRLEPPGKLVPVGNDELKPGVVYLHHSPRLDRQVWSFLQASGEFWHAFGPGSTMPLSQFDLRMTEEEAISALKKIDPRLAFQVLSSAGVRVYLRLETDNTWKLVRTNSVTSIFDLETNQRWEKQWDRFLPVVNICGDTWEFRDGSYQASQWGLMNETELRPDAID